MNYFWIIKTTAINQDAVVSVTHMLFYKQVFAIKRRLQKGSHFYFGSCTLVKANVHIVNLVKYFFCTVYVLSHKI